MTKNAPMRVVRSGGWAMDQRRTIYLCAVVLGVILFFFMLYMRIIWNVYTDNRPGHPPPFGDFFPLWSYAKIATQRTVAELYDMATLHDRQVALGMDPNVPNPFPYPPPAMFLFWPLAWMPYDTSYLVWIIGSLTLFVWTVRATCSRLPPCLLFVLISPASVGNIFMGQSGFISAALLTAGLRLATVRPVAAGILLGLLSYKPQLGILVPVALVAAGWWRVFITAAATVLALALAATLTYGWQTWVAWIAMLPAYADLVDRAPSLPRMLTVIANLQMIGVSLTVAKIAQAGVAIFVALTVARCFRRDPNPLATAALIVGAFLATPHAFFYDLPMVTAAMVLFIQARIDTTGRFSTFELAVLVVAGLFPIAMLTRNIPVPVSAVALLLLFAVIVRAHARSFGDRHLLLDPIPDRLLDMHAIEPRDLLQPRR
jgi:hypothetical protein